MGIYFRDKKYGNTFNASFELFNGEQVGDKSGWMIGDEVSVLFSITSDMADQVNENVAYDSGVRVHKCMMDGENTTVQIPCVVVKRGHACTWKSLGRFQALGTSITLEAKNGLWEDVLKWIVLEEVPSWIDNQSS